MGIVMDGNSHRGNSAIGIRTIPTWDQYNSHFWPIPQIPLFPWVRCHGAVSFIHVNNYYFLPFELGRCALVQYAFEGVLFQATFYHKYGTWFETFDAPV